MCLHLEGCIKLLVTVATLCEVGQVDVLMFAGVDVTLDVLHGPDVVVQHLRAVPTLKHMNKYNVL